MWNKNTGSNSLLDNYRLISLSPIISELFENVLLELYGKHLISSYLQFGFKKKLGCPSAIFVLRQLTEFFNSRSSNVYIASLDASEAFDRVNHFRLFSTLINKHLPVIFIKTIVNWYLKLEIVVRWDRVESNDLRIVSGVHQGGVLSPSLFNIYVDSNH